MLLRCRLATLGTPEDDALGSLPRESLLGALADQVALDLGAETEGKGKDLALYVVPQAVVVLDRPDAALLSHTYIEDLHNHEEVSPETRELAADDDIIACDLAEEVSELPLGVSLGAADGLLDPVIDQEAVSLAEVVDLEALVLYRLLVAADSDVSVRHICD